MKERPVNFLASRSMRCGACLHQWDVCDEWVARFEQGNENCPVCGVDCRGADRPDFWFRADEPALDDVEVRGRYWYHTSTREGWPSTPITQSEQVRSLHVGTYEAAIENMLRRMTDEADSESDFRLYRVRLSPDTIIEPGIHQEPVDWLGNVRLRDIRSDDAVSVYRYVNTHEDPSSVSLVVSASSIAAVQELPIPLAMTPADRPWAALTANRLVAASLRAAPQPRTRLERMRRHPPSALSVETRAVIDEVRKDLPPRLRNRFAPEINQAGGHERIAQFVEVVAGLRRLVVDPTAVIDTIRTQPWRLARVHDDGSDSRFR